MPKGAEETAKGSRPGDRAYSKPFVREKSKLKIKRKLNSSDQYGSIYGGLLDKVFGYCAFEWKNCELDSLLQEEACVNDQNYRTLNNLNQWKIAEPLKYLSEKLYFMQPFGLALAFIYSNPVY